MLNLRADFPIFTAHPQIAYLDTAASAQKPQRVIQAVANFSGRSYANIHRGLYELSIQATEAYESSRVRAAVFVGAASSQEIIFTRGATEGLNLLAAGLSQQWQTGDEVILSPLEHHANLIPWQEAARKVGLTLRFLPLTETGEIDLSKLPELISSRTRAVSLSACSNVLGTLLDAPTVRHLLTEQGSRAYLILDAAQAAPHLPLAPLTAAADFLVFSGHKLYAPSGTGVLWGRKELLEALPPYQVGGDMIRTVTLEQASWNDLPWKFEAGTPNIEGTVGLGEALRYLSEIGMEAVASHTTELSRLLQAVLQAIPEVKILGTPDPRSGIVSFTVKGIHPHDLADLLGQREICLRAGHHCAAPLHAQLDIPASNRASIGVYTIPDEIQRLGTAITEIISDFNHA